MAVALPIVAAVMGGISASNADQANANASEYNAATARENAMLARRKGELDAIQVRRSGRDILGQEVAGYAAAGVSQAGSAADVRASSAQAIETDALTAKYNGELNAIGYDRTAGLDSMQAKSSRSAATWDLLSGIVKGAGAAASAYSQSPGG